MSTPPPSPGDTASWAEFTARLRDLYAWCGSPKYRALSGRNAGLSPAAISTLIGRNPLTRPPETATARFVAACLAYREWPDADAEAARWRLHWEHLDRPRPAAEPTPGTEPVGLAAATGSPTATTPPGTPSAPPSDAPSLSAGPEGTTPEPSAASLPHPPSEGSEPSEPSEGSEPTEPAPLAEAPTPSSGTPARATGTAAPPPVSAPFDGRARRLALVTIAVLAAAVTAAVVAFLVVRSGEPDPANNCLFTRGEVEDSRTGRTWPDLYQCPNRPGSDVYLHPNPDTKIALLKTDPSWFICWTHGRWHSGGNDIWYYTQGDVPTARPELNSWGYVPAYALHVPRHPDPRVHRECGPL